MGTNKDAEELLNQTVEQIMDLWAIVVTKNMGKWMKLKGQVNSWEKNELGRKEKATSGTNQLRL